MLSFLDFTGKLIKPAPRNQYVRRDSATPTRAGGFRTPFPYQVDVPQDADRSPSVPSSSVPPSTHKHLSVQTGLGPWVREVRRTAIAASLLRVRSLWVAGGLLTGPWEGHGTPVTVTGRRRSQLVARTTRAALGVHDGRGLPFPAGSGVRKVSSSAAQEPRRPGGGGSCCLSDGTAGLRGCPDSQWEPWGGGASRVSRGRSWGSQVRGRAWGRGAGSWGPRGVLANPRSPMWRAPAWPWGHGSRTLRPRPRGALDGRGRGSAGPGGPLGPKGAPISSARPRRLGTRDRSPWRRGAETLGPSIAGPHPIPSSGGGRRPLPTPCPLCRRPVLWPQADQHEAPVRGGRARLFAGASSPSQQGDPQPAPARRRPFP